MGICKLCVWGEYMHAHIYRMTCIVSYIKSLTDFFNMTSIQNFARENVGILMSVLDSIWSIVKGNMSVILTIFTELFYIVLMSGSAVLNFVLSTVHIASLYIVKFFLEKRKDLKYKKFLFQVVFFTTLFYLLNSSSKTYKPIELTTMFSPSCHR